MIVAAVPVKRLAEAKSRLAGTLGDQERIALVIELLTRTISALRSSRVIEQIALVTAEIELASRFGISAIPDRGGLNASLEEAVRWAQVGGADGLLVVPGDMPLIAPDDVLAIVRARPEHPGIAIARAHDGGTGALLLSPPDAIPICFGSVSYDRHVASATRRGLVVAPVVLPGLAHDLDTPEDLSRLGMTAGG